VEKSEPTMDVLQIKVVEKPTPRDNDVLIGQLGLESAKE
jgi:hypothetical protein